MIKGKLVYICSPLSAPTAEGIRANMLKARTYAKVISKHFDCRAVAPHAYLPEFIDDTIPKEREIALKFGLAILEISNVVVVCGNRISSGMAGEIEKAKELGIPIFILLEHAGGYVIVKMTQKEGKS